MVGLYPGHADCIVTMRGAVKTAFYKLDEDKRRRIEAAAMAEFGQHGFERGSTDRIVKLSEISKGGLYEYIESKEDLFLHVVRQAYGALYGHIGSILRQKDAIHGDVLHCFKLAAESALDFYLDNPAIVRLIASLSQLYDPDAKARVEEIFAESFQAMFSLVDSSRLRYPLEQVLDILKWLLVKTRNDFIHQLEQSGEREAVSKAYLQEWTFILSLLEHGIYQA